MNTVLVCGSRHWADRQAIYNRLSLLPKNTVIVHGDCRGADQLAGSVAQELGLAVVACPANWEEHGRSAGPIRNRAMLNEFNPELVIAFTQDITQSRGTAHMVRLANERKIATEIYPRKEQ